MEQLLTQPKFASAPLLLDLWDGFTYLPSLKPPRVWKLWAVSHCMESMLAIANIYLPPPTLICRIYAVRPVVLRESDPSTLEMYSSRYHRQGCPRWLREWARLCAPGIRFARSKEAVTRADIVRYLQVEQAGSLMSSEFVGRSIVRLISTVKRLKSAKVDDSGAETRATVWLAGRSKVRF